MKEATPGWTLLHSGGGRSSRGPGHAHRFMPRARTNKDKANKEAKVTDSGRTVYGGGGITPDEKIASPKINKFQTTMFQTMQDVMAYRQQVMDKCSDQWSKVLRGA